MPGRVAGLRGRSCRAELQGCARMVPERDSGTMVAFPRLLRRGNATMRRFAPSIHVALDATIQLYYIMLHRRTWFNRQYGDRCMGMMHDYRGLGCIMRHYDPLAGCFAGCSNPHAAIRIDDGVARCIGALCSCLC